MTFDITLEGDHSETITGANGYASEGPMTTFFASDSGRLSPWATKVASYRTSAIISIRRHTADTPLHAVA